MPYQSKDSFVKKSIIQNKIEQKIIQITNFDHLLKELDIEKTSNIFKSKKVKKLLNQSSINNYTLTYLIHSKVTKFKTKSQSIGGEYISLIHIKTKSKSDHKSIEKILNNKVLKWDNIDKFKILLDNIAKTHYVTFKILLDISHDFLQARDINELINNAKQFATLIQGKEVVYKIFTTHTSSIDPIIKQYLNTQLTVNNLEYIRKNSNQFKNRIDINQLRYLQKYLSRQKRDYTNIEKKELSTINYPKRYNSNILDSPIKLLTLNLKQKHINKKYYKISNDINFTLHYDFNLEIQNDGKIVILYWNKIVKQNKKIVHESKNSKIILDSYINFKDLKAQEFINNNYGSITYKTTFDKYKKEQEIKGYGIIKNTRCGYNVLDKIGTLEIQCTEINFNDINIKYEHTDK